MYYYVLLLLLASQIKSLTEHNESESNRVHNRKKEEHHCCLPFSVMLAHFDHSLQLDKKPLGKKNNKKRVEAVCDWNVDWLVTTNTQSSFCGSVSDQYPMQASHQHIWSTQLHTDSFKCNSENNVLIVWSE